MKVMCLFNTTNAIASGKKYFVTSQIFKIYQGFPVKNGANCETSFPVFFVFKFCQKAAISGLIRLIFGLIYKHPGRTKNWETH